MKKVWMTVEGEEAKVQSPECEKEEWLSHTC